MRRGVSVAKIGDTGYTTLEDAFAAVTKDQIIVLQQDIQSQEAMTLTAGNIATSTDEFTLDLNGHTVTALSLVLNSGTLGTNKQGYLFIKDSKAPDDMPAGDTAALFDSAATSFLNRYAKASSVSAANPFTDVKAGAYYYDAVLWAVKNGITGGTTETTFAPKATCTRAQVVTFIYRYMGK